MRFAVRRQRRLAAHRLPFRSLAPYQAKMIVRDIPWRAPYAAFSPLDGVPHAHLLHGGDVRESGWSMIVASPARVFRLEDADDVGQWLSEIDDEAKRRHKAPGDDAPFQSGLIGYLGYEALAALEPSLCLPKSPYAFPLAQFGAYNATAIFDRKEQRAFISGVNSVAVEELEAQLGRDTASPIFLPVANSLESNFTREEYIGAITDVIERIRNGDFFQANIAQTLTAIFNKPVSPFAFFRKVAAASDAFFASLLQFEEGAIVSNSPERFFKLGAEGEIIAEPIKGTRPRGRNAIKDEALAKELLADPKDRAENIMIADLVRNDLSKICEDGSIKEDAICELMTLTRVHHLVSRIRGKVRAGMQMRDIFSALFPSGSITGAPKVEAMKTIAEIEGAGRGPYCGAVGYIDDSGGADFAVAIRTMMIDKTRRRISIPVGGGVTQRSDPAAEYKETLTKASAALAALGVSADHL